MMLVQTPTTLRDIMIIKLMQTPVPEVANCQFFFTKSQPNEANFSITMRRKTTTANTAVKTREICGEAMGRYKGRQRK